jgi:RNA polymerase sigma-70 factor (ECF subfamily)
MESNEEKLLELLARDLHRYFEQLVLTYQDRLYAFTLSRIHNPQSAEEILLVALERAYYALKSYPAQRILGLRLEPWLYEITRNVYYNHLRDARTRDTRLPSIPLDLTEESPLLEIEDQSVEPDELACRKEDREELEVCIGLLPRQYQRALRLYYFENLLYREIGEQLCQPVGTVKANIHRGTKLLRHVLQTYVATHTQTSTREVK